jgi:hypothetical protein
MTEIVEKIVQRFTEAAPIEATVSSFVSQVLENTAAKLARFESAAHVSEEEAA